MDPTSCLERAGLHGHESPIQLAGGDMGLVWRVGSMVVKCMQAGPPHQLKTESKGLAQLAHAGCRTPHIHHVDHDCLIMDYIDAGPPNWRDLAAQLAALHRPLDGQYGADETIFIGRLPLAPVPRTTHWPTFWRHGRIEPLLKLTADTLGPLAGRIERLLDDYTPPTEGPCLLHGDLWNGNVIMGREGAYLIDPSVWMGERSVDLAMMRLFGGFPQLFWDCYEAHYPIPPDVESALPFHQLYFLLVHVHFFGRSYCGGVQRVLERYDH